MRVKVFIEQGKLKAMLVKKNSQDFFLLGESEGKDFTSCVVAEKFAHFDEYRLLELKRQYLLALFALWPRDNRKMCNC